MLLEELSEDVLAQILDGSSSRLIQCLWRTGNRRIRAKLANGGVREMVLEGTQPFNWLSTLQLRSLTVSESSNDPVVLKGLSSLSKLQKLHIEFDFTALELLFPPQTEKQMLQTNDSSRTGGDDNGASNGEKMENKKILSPYRVYDAEEGETVAQLALRNGIKIEKGDAFYQLSKPEDVSAEKTLVLRNSSDGCMSDDQTSIRSQLGLKGAKKDKIAPHMVPGGYCLFVQSTSPNRKLTSGPILVRSSNLADEEANGDGEEEDDDDADADEDLPVRTSSGKRRRVEVHAEEEEEEDDDDDGGSESDADGRGNSSTKRSKFVENIGSVDVHTGLLDRSSTLGFAFPKLLDLTIGRKADSLTSHHIKALPSSLTRLELHDIDFTDLKHSDWPSSLTTLVVNGEISISNFSNFPRHLTTLELTYGEYEAPDDEGDDERYDEEEDDDEEDEDGPAILGRKTLKKVDGEMWSNIKSKLLKDSAGDDDRKETTERYISKVESGKLFGLPLTLRRFRNAGAIGGESIQWILPPLVESVDLELTRSICDVSTFWELLPPSVHHLTIRSWLGCDSECGAQWKVFEDPSTSALFRNTHLTSMYLPVRGLHIDQNFSKCIPRTLRELTLQLRDVSLDATTLQHLPPTLERLRLELHSIYPDPEENWVSSLPRGLQYLTVLRLDDPSELTKSLLPPGLKSLVWQSPED